MQPSEWGALLTFVKHTMKIEGPNTQLQGKYNIRSKLEQKF
jgi:hypothetical protein